MLNFATIQTVNVAKHLAKNPVILARGYKVDLSPKVVWERPEKPKRYGSERSGDIGKYVPPDPSNICLQYRYATELEDAEPNVRNQFTLGWHPDEYSRDFYEKTLMDSVRSHIYDYKSPVALIAQLTGTIRFIQYQMEEFKVRSGKRRFYRREVLQFIEQRHEMLKNLRETDYKQYEWLLERLDLQFKPQPQKEDEIMVARKEGLRQMTKAYCDGIREQRLNAYRDELKAQQVPFLEQKLKNLEFIRNEQIELKTTVTITQQQIDDVRKQYEELKQIQDTHKVESTKKKWKIY